MPFSNTSIRKIEVEVRMIISIFTHGFAAMLGALVGIFLFVSYREEKWTTKTLMNLKILKRVLMIHKLEF